MKNLKRINTYSDLIGYYEAQCNRIDQIDELLEKLKHRLQPSLIAKRRELSKAREEIVDELWGMDNFVTEALTFKRSVFINLLTKFYSYHNGFKLKAFEIWDKSVGKYARKATIIVSERDYQVIAAKFNLKGAVDSRDLEDVCQDEFIYIDDDKKVQLYDGVYLSKDYKAFKELDPVLEATVTYYLQNKNMSNVACLERALNDYVTSYGKNPLRDEYGIIKLDPEVQAEVAKTVQRIMDEDKYGASSCLIAMLEGSTPKEVAEARGMTRPSGTTTILPEPEKTVVQVASPESLQKLAQEFEQNTESDKRGLSETDMLLSMLHGQKIITQTTEKVPETAKKVVNVQPVPVEKQEQYDTEADILLAMLNGTYTVKEESESKKLGLKK